MSFKSLKDFGITEAITVSAISVVAYLATFIFESGYLFHFGMPNIMVEVSVRQMLNALTPAIGIGIVLITSSHSFFFSKRMSDLEKIGVFFIQIIFSICLYVLFSALLSGELHWNIVIPFLLMAVVSVSSSNFVLKKLNGYILLILGFFAIFIFFLAFFLAGKFYAGSQKNFLLTQIGSEKYVFVREYNDRDLFVEIERKWTDLYNCEYRLKKNYLLQNKGTESLKFAPIEVY